MTAAVAAVNGEIFFTDALQVSSIVRVRVSDPMWTNALHDPLIVPIHLWPVFHVVVGWVVNATVLPAAFVW